MVTTPVPPMPVTTISKGFSMFISLGFGNLLNIFIGKSDAGVTFLFLILAP